MTQTSKPSQQQEREWMQKRQAERTPPPSPEQIRRQLGWDLVAAEAEARMQRTGRGEY